MLRDPVCVEAPVHHAGGSMLQDRRREGEAPSSGSWDPWGELETVLLSLMLFSALFPFL